MKYRCLRDTLVQIPPINRAFQAGQTMTVNLDIHKSKSPGWMSICRNFQALPGQETPPEEVDPDALKKKLKGMKRDEVFAYAESQGLRPTDSQTKAEIAEMILNPPDDPDLTNLGNREAPPEVITETIVAPQ